MLPPFNHDLPGCSDDMQKKIYNMIDTLDETKLDQAFNTAENLYVHNNNAKKIFTPLRMAKSFFRTPNTNLNVHMQLQSFLCGNGKANMNSEKFFLVTTLLNIPLSHFSNPGTADEAAKQLVSDVSTALRRKGHIIFATTDDIETLSERIKPMLENLTPKQLEHALCEARDHYLTGDSMRYGNQGYSLFGKSNKLLINTRTLKDGLSVQISCAKRLAKSTARMPSKNPGISSKQELLDFLSTSDHKDALSLNCQVIAYLLQFKITNNEDIVASTMINRVMNHLLEEGLTPFAGKLDVEMKSITKPATKPTELTIEEQLRLIENLIYIKNGNLTLPNLKKIVYSYDDNPYGNNNSSSSDSDQSYESAESEEDNNNRMSKRV